MSVEMSGRAPECPEFEPLAEFAVGAAVRVVVQKLHDDSEWRDVAGAAFTGVVQENPTNGRLEDDRISGVNVLPDKALPEGNPYATRHPRLIESKPFDYESTLVKGSFRLFVRPK